MRVAPTTTGYVADEHRPQTLGAALAQVSANITGLTSDEAARRLSRYGSNAIAGHGEGHPIALLVRQFRSPLVLILIAASVLTFAVGETDEALIIGGIVLASSALGFWQEFRAATAMAALRARVSVTAEIVRDGTARRLPAAEVVPGDLVLLRAGSLVPADGVVIDAASLLVDEAALTGESFPVEKEKAGESRLEAANLLHLGTSVRSGTGSLLVLATGRLTQFGAIAASVGRLEPETDFARGVRRFGLLMTQVMLAMVLVIFPINILLGRPMLESLLFSAALAVGLTPELLPAIVSVTLSRGARALADAGVLVRRLVAIENIGAMDVLCTDKTGTITQGVVSLDLACDVDGAKSDLVLRLAALNAALQSAMPNALDTAIVAAVGTPAADQHRLDEVPYDFDRRRLSILVDSPSGRQLITKGAVGSVLPICASIRHQGTPEALTAERRSAEEQRLAAWSGGGYRVLAVATRDMAGRTDATPSDETELVLEGYLLFADPLKPGVADVIRDLSRMGVRLKMITGDNRFVAAHVAEAAGISSARIVAGDEISRLSSRALAHRVAGCDVFAEVTPDHKERIIAALRRRGRVVGYLGDGINDAPALRAADLGISVDTALEAAKDAADVVLLQHDLGVLRNGIVLGRSAFANTLKYISITTSANLGNMISMAVASLVLPFLPLLAKQILLNNTLSDLPMLAVSTDRVDPEVLAKPGRWDFAALLRSMFLFGLISSVFDGLTFLVLLVVIHGDEPTFQTGWFAVSVLTELVIIFVMRTRGPALLSAPAPLLGGIAVLVAVVSVALQYSPLAAPLGFVPLPIGVQAALLGVVLAYGMASEVAKRGAARWLAAGGHHGSRLRRTIQNLRRRVVGRHRLF